MGRLQPPAVAPGFGSNDMPFNFSGGASTPARMERASTNAKRKQTLLSLLDALNELKNNDDLDNPGASQWPSTFEPETDGPTADEHLQIVGAEAFNRFQRRMNNLDKELRNFANASRQLGSSVGILSSSFHLRERIAQVLFLFRENAADLFPRKVSRHAKEPVQASAPNRKKARRPPPHIARPVVVSEDLDAEDFPSQLADFARDVMTFLRSLNEFPEFTDEAVNNSISLFEGDLKYWASCLKTYEGQFKYPAVQRYLHDITSEMGEHLDTITSSLSMFLEIGIPTIRFAQKHAAANLLNLTTVATFFSAVTASTLQVSFGQQNSEVVNAFWFCSLVFSIASAVNSLLGLTWKQAMYRSPGHRVPWWVLIWIKRSPLIFLVISVAAFSVGLCLFAYSSGQSPVTAALTTVFTAFSSFGLVAVSAWFAFERWTFNRHRGKKWLMDVLADISLEFTRLPLIGWMVKVPSKQAKRVSGQLRRAGTSLSRVGSRLSTVVSPQDRSDSGSNSPGPTAGLQLGPAIPPSPLASPSPLPSAISEMTVHPLSAPALASGVSMSIQPSQSTSSSSAPASPAKSRFTSAVRSVMMLRTASATATASPIQPQSPRRQRTSSTNVSGQEPRVRREPTDPLVAMRGSRAAALIPALKSLEPTQDLPPHQALVRHLQFSPNGQFLATCSWDRTCVVFNVGNPFSVHRVLAHPQGFVGQVAWSPAGNLLLTKMHRGIKVWSTESGVCTKTIDRHRAVQSITWCPGGEAFMSVEDSGVTKLDLHGKVLDSCRFPAMKLHDVAVTPDNQRLLGVATLLASADGLQPRKSRAEKQIIVYNLDKKEIENQVPVLHDVRDITLAKNGKVALVSYENKAPPQLWRVELVKDRTNEANYSARLSLRHTYMPKMPVDFAGPSYFGGKDDQLVLCAGKTGDIHIWERDTGILLHYFRAQEVDADLTCIAWNHSAFMFSTGSHDGAVRIWTAPPSANGILRSGSGTPRSTTPPPFLQDPDKQERSESPTMQDFDSEERPARTSGEDNSRTERRNILFASLPRMHIK